MIICQLSDEFPIIAVAYHKGLMDEESMYPILHAKLAVQKTDKRELYVDFQYLCLDGQQSLEFEMQKELAVFIGENYKNKFKYKIGNEFYVLFNITSEKLCLLPLTDNCIDVKTKDVKVKNDIGCVYPVVQKDENE